MNRPMWFEYLAVHPEKLADFYVAVFGWEKRRFKGDEEYWTLLSGPVNKPGLNGGIMEKGDFKCPINYIEVDDIDLYTTKVTNNGGKIFKEKVKMDEYGYTIWCTDPEDNLLGIMQPLKKHDKEEVETPFDVRTKNRPFHFEIPATDPEKLALFYESVFGWKKQRWDDSNYWIMNTGEIDEPGMSGAITDRSEIQCTVNTIVVYNIDLYLDKVIEAGGKIVKPKNLINKIGFHAYCLDPEGNEFGILQPEMMEENTN